MSRLSWFRLMFAICVAAGVVVLLARLSWEARLVVRLPDGHYEFIVRLGRGPIWAPPPLPPRERFEEEFQDVPKSGGRSVRNADWQVVALEGTFGLWIIALLFTPLYLLELPESIDPAFQVCTRLAWTIPLWGVGCFVFWPCWSCCLFFGIAHGVLAGLVSYVNQTTRPAVPVSGSDSSPPVS